MKPVTATRRRLVRITRGVKRVDGASNPNSMRSPAVPETSDMKIYEAMDPYSRLVRMLCDEKEIDMESVVLSVGAGDAIGKPHLARSPLGQVPVLELESGAHISGSMAICEYLEERVPHPAL